jgi:hypothetical protein
MKKITFTTDEVEKIKDNAKQAEWISGFSCIRTDKEIRKENMSNDQITGQLGEAALSKFLTGDIDLYIKTRDLRNSDKYKGDDGSDLNGYRVDSKTSRMRAGFNYDYHLYVRNREYHEDVMYYLCLVPVKENNVVYIMGKKLGKELPPPIGDRRELPMSKLDKI